MPSLLGVQFLYSVDEQQEFGALTIGIVAQCRLRTLCGPRIIGVTREW